MPRFSANLSMLFTELPMLERFEAARRAGFAAVEIQFPYDLAIESLRGALHDSGLPLVLINVPAGDLLSGGDGLACVPGEERAFSEALVAACAYGSALGVRCINVLAGRVPSGSDRDACSTVFRENLARAADRLSRLGIVPVVEALNGHDVDRFLLQRHDEVVSMLDAVGHEAIRIQYDVYHQARMGRDVVADLRDDLERIGHVQIADVPSRTAPRTGTLDWDGIFATLDQGGYDGFVGAEYRVAGPTSDTLAWLRASS